MLHGAQTEFMPSPIIAYRFSHPLCRVGYPIAILLAMIIYLSREQLIAPYWILFTFERINVMRTLVLSSLWARRGRDD